MAIPPSAPANGASTVDENLAIYASELRASPHNLLSPRGLQELEVRHFPEAVIFSEGLPRGARLLDVGSGGGLPGLVIAICRPDLEVHLLEATRKKADFLRDTVARLGLVVEVHHGRAEDLARGPLRESFDLVTARAVAPLERLIPWTAPYLRPGGRIHAIKGEQWRDELEAAGPTVTKWGLTVVATPGGGEQEGGAGVPKVVVLERTPQRLVQTTKK